MLQVNAFQPVADSLFIVAPIICGEFCVWSILSYSVLLSLLDKFKVTSEHVLIIGHCTLI